MTQIILYKGTLDLNVSMYKIRQYNEENCVTAYEIALILHVFNKPYYSIRITPNQSNAFYQPAFFGPQNTYAFDLL